jgi:hypothetical protein
VYPNFTALQPAETQNVTLKTGLMKLELFLFRDMIEANDSRRQSFNSSDHCKADWTLSEITVPKVF